MSKSERIWDLTPLVESTDPSLVQERLRLMIAEADKMRVESADIIHKASTDLAIQYREQVKELEGVIVKLQRRIDDLQLELKNAYVEIKRLNEALKFANRNK